MLERIVDVLSLPPKDLLAWLGPAIGPLAFEVGADVFDVFAAFDPEASAAFRPLRERKWLADLYTLARQRLSNAGVTRVYGGGFCTYTETGRFFSYRREKESGRMGSFIWIDR